MSDSTSTQAAESTKSPFTPSLAKHYANRGASLYGKIRSLKADAMENGCDSPKFLRLMERLEKDSETLEETILACAVGGRLSTEELVSQAKTGPAAEERRLAEERAKRARKAAKARKAKQQEQAAAAE